MLRNEHMYGYKGYPAGFWGKVWGFVKSDAGGAGTGLFGGAVTSLAARSLMAGLGPAGLAGIAASSVLSSALARMNKEYLAPTPPSSSALALPRWQ